MRWVYENCFDIQKRSKLHIDKESLVLLHSLMIFFMSFNLYTKSAFLIESKHSKNVHGLSPFAHAPPALKIMQTVGLSKKNFSLPWPKLTTVDDVTIGFFSEMFVGHRKWEKLSKFVVPFTSKQEWCFFQAENQLKRRALTLATRHLRHQNATPNIPGPSFFPNIFWYLSKSKDYINISLEFP